MHTFVTVRGTSSSEVLLETWDAGASSYWTLDPETGTFAEVAWKPQALPIRNEILTDADLDEMQPVRTSCILEEQILVVDGLPNGSDLGATASVVNTTTGELVVDGAALDLGRNVVLDKLLCAPGTGPRLVAVDHGTNQPVAFDLAIGSGTVEAVSSTAAPPAPGPLVDITYGPSSVAIQYLAGPPQVTLDEPTSPDEAGTVTSTTELGVVMFEPNGWESVVDPSDGSVQLGDRVYPLPESGTPLVIHSVQSDEFRVAG